MTILKYLILTVTLLNTLSLNAKSGEKKENESTTPLKGLIRRIERRSDYLFVYNDNVDVSIRVKVPGGESDVIKMLDTALAPTNIGYRVEGHYISLSVKKTAPPTAVARPQSENETTPPPLLPGDMVEEIEEVVVVGMGYQRKVSVVGAISTINMRNLKTSSNRALSNSFAGRIAGIVGQQLNGEPGRDRSEFWIRGISTFGTNRTPLVMVDGVERADAMDNLMPEEIAHISILKDASATAVYGSRAANGVVVIETRKGFSGKRAAIEVNMESGLTRLARMPELLGGVDYMLLSNELLGGEYALKDAAYSTVDIEMTRAQTDPMLYPDVNWMREVFKKNSHNKNISTTVSGGGDMARYFIALGYLNERGNYREAVGGKKSNTDFSRYNLRSNLDVSLTPSTTLNVELSGYFFDGQYAPSSILPFILQTTPIAHPVKYPITGDDGHEEYVWAAKSQQYYNPVQLLNSGSYNASSNQFLGQARLVQDFDRWVRGLSANAALSFDTRSDNYSRVWEPEPSYIATGRDENGKLILSMVSKGEPNKVFKSDTESDRVTEFKAQVNYERSFGLSHRFSAMAMYYQRDLRDTSPDAEYLYSIPYRKQGVAFRTTYSWNDRYFAEFNLGYNGSENFKKGERFGLFPAGAVGWMVSNEKFWRDGAISRVIPSLKLRASIGLVGSEDLPDFSRFAYITSVTESAGYGFGRNEVHIPGVEEYELGVPNLTWEKGLKRNFGIEIWLPRHIASIGVDFFHETRSDILVQRASVPDVVGTYRDPVANLGRMRNRGVDGSIDIAHNFGSLGVRVYSNVTFSVNKILEMDEVALPWDNIPRTGKPLSVRFGYVALGYFTDEQDVENSPKQTFGSYGPGDIKYLDTNGDNVVDVDDMVQIGHGDVPQLTYGFGLQLDFRGFDLAMFFRGNGHVSKGLGIAPFVTGKKGNNKAMLKVALDRWTPEDPRQDAFYPRLLNRSFENNFNYPSTKWIVDSSMMRLADVEVGYTFPHRWTSRAGIERVRVYFHGTNLAVLSKFKLWDPEGFSDGSSYPPQKKYNLGLSFNF
jgi:TonB-linked SusC/RagA family outer membrane protein